MKICKQSKTFEGIDILFVLVSIFSAHRIINIGGSILRNRQEVRFRGRSLDGRIKRKIWNATIPGTKFRLNNLLFWLERRNSLRFDPMQ